MTNPTGWVIGAVVASLAGGACSRKADYDKVMGAGSGSAIAAAAAEGSGSATVAAGSAAPTPTAAADPWAGPLTGATSTVNAQTGGDLAKAEASTSPIADAAFEKKSKAERDRLLKLIAAPAENAQLAIKNFANVETSYGFRVTYNASRNVGHERFRTIFEKNRVFEQVAEGLNKTVRIPATVDIQTVDCNTVNAFYDPRAKRIIVCYELLDYFLDVFKPTAKSETELGNAVMGAVMFSFFHEAGHGLIHLLELPAVGREEDSADQLATLILIAAGDEGVAMALSGAYWFQLQSTNERKTPFWDEHAFDAQRFYNILCLIYGSNPDKYAAFVASGSLPKDRAQRCPDEYAKINKAWEKLLQPHLTNGAALNVSYKPSVPAAEAPTATTVDPWGGSPATPTSPAVPAPPPPPPPPTATVTCEQVADRAAELVGAEAEARAKTMTPAQVDELKAQLEAQLPAVMEQILAACAKEDWSDGARKCVLDAKTLDAATTCGT